MKNSYTQEIKSLAKDKGFDNISELSHDDLMNQLKEKHDISIVIDSNILIDDNTFEIWKNGKKVASGVSMDPINNDEIFLQALQLVN